MGPATVIFHLERGFAESTGMFELVKIFRFFPFFAKKKINMTLRQ